MKKKIIIKMEVMKKNYPFLHSLKELFFFEFLFDLFFIFFIFLYGFIILVLENPESFVEFMTGFGPIWVDSDMGIVTPACPSLRDPALLFRSMKFNFDESFFIVLLISPLFTFIFNMFFKRVADFYIVRSLAQFLSNFGFSGSINQLIYLHLHYFIYLFLSCFSVFLSFYASMHFFFINVKEGSLVIFFNSFFNPFFELSFLSDIFSFNLDPLSSVMCCVITFVSLVVHLYSCWYLSSDPRLVRFLSFLNLFTFFMILIVISDSFIQFFLAWEGVGLSSYLLINFWNTRHEANKSSFKAIALNRFGDVSLLIAFSVIIIIFGTSSIHNFLDFLDFLDLFQMHEYTFFSFKVESLSFISFFILVAAFAKSAQFGLHTWLPDAMEGPTPVSALLHAATMVTAGIYLVCRFSFLFEKVPSILFLCVVFGSITAFFGSFNALFQFDLKKIIAFSTTSQLGYMFVACGFSAYNLAMYHLVTHAFFKALLFLMAGVYIHTLNNEQDIRKMGGFGNYMPLNRLFFFSGILSLSGFPYLSGYYSKDAIIHLAFSFSSKIGLACFILIILATFFTVCYSFRVLYYLYQPKFTGSKEILKKVEKLGYSIDMPNFIFFILLPLFVGTIFSGFFFKDLLIGLGTTFWDFSLAHVSSDFEFFDNLAVRFRAPRFVGRQLVNFFFFFANSGLIDFFHFCGFLESGPSRSMLTRFICYYFDLLSFTVILNLNFFIILLSSFSLVLSFMYYRLDNYRHKFYTLFLLTRYYDSIPSNFLKKELLERCYFLIRDFKLTDLFKIYKIFHFLYFNALGAFFSYLKPRMQPTFYWFAVKRDFHVWSKRLLFDFSPFPFYHFNGVDFSILFPFIRSFPIRFFCFVYKNYFIAFFSPNREIDFLNVLQAILSFLPFLILKVYNFFCSRWYVDYLYNAFFSFKFLQFSKLIYETLEKGFFYYFSFSFFPKIFNPLYRFFSSFFNRFDVQLFFLLFFVLVIIFFI